MNLIGLFKRASRSNAPAGASHAMLAQPVLAASVGSMPAHIGGTVIPLRSRLEQHLAGPFGAAELEPPQLAQESASQATGGRPCGLLATPEMKAVLGRDHYASGRHHGSVFRSREALERGLEAIVSTFQNEAATLAERRHVRLDKLLLERQKIEGLSDVMGQTLTLAGDQVRREIDLLRHQIELAAQRKGWVLDALNRYQLGFDRGVREALDFELLGS